MRRERLHSHVQSGDEAKNIRFLRSGAQCAKVSVDSDLGLVRVLRMVSVLRAGHGIDQRRLAITGSAPAIANSVLHATWRRVRDSPITIETMQGCEEGSETASLVRLRSLNV
jgi:CO/xanthine dehydrogenase Mo-binding subunit